jgi:hypothetical protein
MKQIRRSYADFNEFVKNEPELVESLIQMINENSEEEVTELVTYNWRNEKYPMTEIGDIIGLIQDWGDYDETISSLYVDRTYSMETDDGKFSLEAYGSSYRKDLSICDEKMGDEILVIDNIALVLQEEREKVIKAEKKKAEHANKWKSFIKEKQNSEVFSLNGILDELMNNYEFPKKIK